jgi:hypothetical protein
MSSCKVIKQKHKKLLDKDRNLLFQEMIGNTKATKYRRKIQKQLSSIEHKHKKCLGWI